MHNLFINRTKICTKNNTIDRVPIVLFFCFLFSVYISQISQKQPQIFDLPHKHNGCFQLVKFKKSFSISFLLWCLGIYIKKTAMCKFCSQNVMHATKTGHNCFLSWPYKPNHMEPLWMIMNMQHHRMTR